MPNLTNAKKALKQSLVRAERNQAVTENIEWMRRSFRKLVESGKVEEAQKLVRDLGKALDKAVTKKVVKLNAAARIKSRSIKALKKIVK